MRKLGLARRILVTGGAGFLGSHFCERLLKTGAEVICADNFHTGQRANIALLLSNPMFEVLPHDGRVVSSFILQALDGKDITVYGDGTQTRSFCYVDDLIEALIKLMNSPDDFTGPVNLGNPTVKLDEGLRAAIEYFEGTRAA